MRDISKLAVVIAWLLWPGVVLSAQGQMGCAVSARVSPAKGSYIFQKPIRLSVTLSNSGPSPSAVSLIFPYFNGQMVFKGDGQDLAPRDEFSTSVVGVGGRSIPHKIEPGGTWEFTVFLQTYYASPQPGLHEFHFTMAIPCVAQGEGISASISNGDFSVRVEPPNPRQLKRIVADYSAQLTSGEPTALEALLSMDTPLVIPELAKILDGGNAESALKTLSRFKGDPRAQQMVHQAVLSKLPSRQIAATELLSKWKQQIPDADLKSLLESPSRDVRIAALRHLQALPDSKYLPLVSPLMSDADENVASEAKRTGELLKGKAQ